MARFEELQQLWQQQPERGFTRRDAAELTHAFGRYGRRNDWIGVLKFAVIAIQLCFLVSVFRHRPVTLFGACVMDFSALYFMLGDWRNQRAIARMDFTAPSVQFVRAAMARLHAQRSPFHGRDFRIALTGFWAGCAIMLAGRWSKMTYPGNLLFIALLMVMTFAAFAFGRWLRGKRFDHECRPLIERLEQVLATMQEPTESDRL
ncbi:MAG: hypothetical protein ABI806_04740 [Candidatus Solibacter sp.]